MKRKNSRQGLQARSLREMGALLCMLWFPFLAFGQENGDTLTRRKLEEVVVRERKHSGKERVSREKMTRVPSLLGEYDLVKYLATLPGVFSVNALDPGIYVRGGSSTENAFFVNDMEVANPNHLTGIISMFDSYVLGDSRFYKSGFPSRYNNYLSAYANMIPTVGDTERYHGELSLGLLSSSLKVQGPLKKNSTSFVLSGRTSYLQHMARLYNKANDSESMPLYGFSDITLGMNSRLNSRWSVSLFGLYTNDRLRINLQDNAINHALGWNTFSSNVKVRYVGTRGDLSFGGNVMRHQAKGKSGGYAKMETDNKYRTWGAYTRYSHQWGNGLQGEIGGTLESSLFDLDYQGCTRVNIYRTYANLLYEPGNHWSFSAGLNYQFHQGNARVGSLSPRLNVNYTVGDWNIWGDYAKSVQYETLYPYFTLRSPVDMRYPLEKGMQPAVCHHVSVGVDREVREYLYFYIALFYKRMLHVKDFLSGIKMSQESISGLLVEGDGEAKGIEMDVSFEREQFYGRANYTLSESTREFEAINEGKRFHSPFDMTHRFLLNMSFRLSAHWQMNTVWTYASGGYATFPVSVGVAQDITSLNGSSKFVPIYRDRYNFRLPDNHRLDVSIDHEKRYGAYLFRWSAGVYNVYNQQNPTFVYFKPKAKDRYYTSFVPYSKALLPCIPYVLFTLEW